MKRAALLAILQQSEYDLGVFRRWLRAQRPEDEEVQDHLDSLQPERRTFKLRLIAALSWPFSLLLGNALAIQLVLLFVLPLQYLATSLIVWRARLALRRAQRRGLRVIGIAGSFGKTSLKHSTFHLLSSYQPTLMTPGSYNTPLGIAQTILHQLRPWHEVFLVELGEYQEGDLAGLLGFVQPETVILAPIGYAHLERFKTKESMAKAFTELWRVKHRPQHLFIDDANTSLLDVSQQDVSVHWYGEKSNSQAAVLSLQPSLEIGQAEIRLASQRYSVKTNLLGQHQLRNCLPGLLLLQQADRPLEVALKSLQYHPAVERRLELHFNPNGTLLIDNSYNTNPASWAEMKSLISTLKLQPMTIITSGFVELDAATTSQAHHTLAKDLAQVASKVGIIRTRVNDDLILQLEKNREITVVTGLTLNEVLLKLAQTGKPTPYLWIEGGARELYL